MGLSLLARCGAAAVIGAIGVVCSFSAVRGSRSASTVDDTGSIFDESRSSSDDIAEPAPPPPAPANPDAPLESPTAAERPKPRIAKPAPPPSAPVAAVKSSHATRLPVPDTKARAASLKVIRDVYRLEYSKTAPADLCALAQRLLDQSRETANGEIDRYVLLIEASNRAATGGDGPLAMKAIRGLARTFQTDGPSAALSALTTAAKVNVSADQSNATARTALDFSREAVAANDLTTAGSAVQVAQLAARRGKDVALLSALKQQADRVAELRRSADAIKDQAIRLKADPNDAAACLAVGKYRCLVRGDWVGGMGLLARCSDSNLKSLAKRDVALRTAAPDAAETKSAEMVQLMADAWQAASGQVGADTAWKRALQVRAFYWYSRCLADLPQPRRDLIEHQMSLVRQGNLEPGLEAHYYNNHRFSHEALARIDPQINFDWKEGSPGPGVNADGFAIWWQGFIKSSTPGRHTLVVDHDDACRLMIDGKEILVNGGVAVDTLEVELTAELQTFELDYAELTGPARMSIGWRRPGSAKVEPIPAGTFFHEPPGPLKFPLPRPNDLAHFNGHVYKRFDLLIPWYAAKKFCEDRGGHLAFVETPDEQQFVCTLLVPDQGFWIGLNDEEVEGVYRWADGRPAQYFAWGPQDPNEGENANFIAEWQNKWADSSTGGLGFVCEWDD